MPEEYYDYVFPNEEKASGKRPSPQPHINTTPTFLSSVHPLRYIYVVGLKILENAMKWKQMMAAGAPASSS
jgi:hypothetical protein